MTDSLALLLPDGTSVSVPFQEQVFTPWLVPAALHSYGPKPLVLRGGEGVFAEVAFAGVLRDRGWDAVWASTYGGLRFFAQQPVIDRSNTTDVPERVHSLLGEIALVNGTVRRPSMSGMFDVVAWRGEEVCFHELKRSGKDRIQGTQRRWLWAALKVGVPLERLRIVEWHFVGDVSQARVSGK